MYQNIFYRRLDVVIMESDDSTSPGPATGKHKSMSRESKKSSPDPSRCLMSPVKKLSALRLVSPFDTDQDPIDLEVATVLADGITVLFNLDF